MLKINSCYKHLVDQPGKGLLDLFENKEGIVADGKVESSLGHSDYEIVEF